MSPLPIQLIAGLANPGRKYAKSRHNAGAWLLEAFIGSESLPPLKPEAKFHGSITVLSLSTGKCWLLLPTTYMNQSGVPIKALSHFYQIPPEAILIIHDELDLSAGTIRFKQGGGIAGHNGLRDIVKHLHSHAFWRLRVGIGHPGERDEVHDYVLSPPSPQDRQKIDIAISCAITLLIPFLQGDQEKVMQVLHGPKIKK